jgi:hypothetical protein
MQIATLFVLGLLAAGLFAVTFAVQVESPEAQAERCEKELLLC